MIDCNCFLNRRDGDDSGDRNHYLVVMLGKFGNFNFVEIFRKHHSK
jgi:hypothetical protein